MAEVSGGRALLDTSVAIALDRIPLDRLPEKAAISTLCLAELSAGPSAAGEDELERVRRQDRVQRFESEVDALPFDANCARAYGAVYAAIVAAGRKARGARSLDLMIAATALANDLPLYTLNPGDFHGLGGLVEIVDAGA